MSGLLELPIGTGRAGRRWRDPEKVDEVSPADDGGGVEGGAAATSSPASRLALLPELETPRVELVVWDERRLRKPLKLVGKTVNWQIRRRTGLETDAGVMTEENLEDIGEPLAEVLNRYEPTRALAERSTELNLALAIYEYVQETAHKAGRARLLAVEAERLAGAARQGGLELAVDGHPPEEVPEL